MLRIELTAEALLHTRFAPAPAPLLELGFALATLQGRDVIFDRWRGVHRGHGIGSGRALLDLVPATGAGPTFIDPISEGLDDGLDLVLSSTDELVGAELRRVSAAGQTITPWMRALDARDRDAWTTLHGALRTGHEALIRPHWHRIVRAYHADVAMRTRLAAAQGLRAMLVTLYPRTRWNGTVLEVPVPSRLNLTTGPAGVVLMPVVFWTGQPLVAPNPDGSLLIVYSAATPLPLVEPGQDDDSLANLLGATRAAVLAGSMGPQTTSDLARLLGVSAASVSTHTKILRAAGLITTTREGKAVLHCVTRLGAQLVGTSEPTSAVG